MNGAGAGYIVAGYTICLGVLFLYAVSLVLRRRRLARSAALAEQRPPGSGGSPAGSGAGLAAAPAGPMAGNGAGTSPTVVGGGPGPGRTTGPTGPVVDGDR